MAVSGVKKAMVVSGMEALPVTGVWAPGSTFSISMGSAVSATDLCGETSIYIPQYW